MNTFAQALPFDIAVVGLGIAGAHHITREAAETMRACRQTFVADQAPGLVDVLRTLSPDVVDLAGLFAADGHRLTAYRSIASEVVTAAIETPPVCFATYGHPKMYSYPTVLIQRAAAVMDLRVAVLPGISFLDTLLVDLSIDPGFDGLQMYEATDLLVRRRPLQNDVACVIAQVTVVASATERPASANLSNLARLEKYLLEFYPRDHRAAIVVSKTHPLLEPVLTQTRLDALATTLAEMDHSGTLYIPPVRRRPVADEPLARQLSASLEQAAARTS